MRGEQSGKFDAAIEKIVRAYDVMSKTINPVPLLKIELTPAQIKVLMSFDAPAGHTMTELGRANRVTVSTMTSMVDLLEQLHRDAKEDRLDHRLATLCRPKLLILDEMGYFPLDRMAAQFLFQLVSRRYGRGAIILTSNKSYGDWGEIFADQVLAYGRDVYGTPSPLFVDGINVDPREPVKWRWADGKEWVLCNLANQQGLFRLLDGLSLLTGDPQYRSAALDANRYAFEHLRYGTQNNGGLLAWGGHLAYTATDDVLEGNPDGRGRIHELKCFFPYYALMWEANPKATQQLIENIWSGHVLDWKTLDFNRHGSPTPRGALVRADRAGRCCRGVACCRASVPCRPMAASDAPRATRDCAAARVRYT